MEILYPDVIGSGGAPKRIMRPRRQTDGAAPVDEGPMPGTNVIAPPNTQAAIVDGTATRALLSQTPSSNGSIPPQQTVGPGATLVAGASALTPPEDTLTQAQGRKRRQQGHPTASLTSVPNGHSMMDVASPPVAPAPPSSHETNSPSKRRRTSQNPASFSFVAPPAANTSSQAQTQSQLTGEPTTVAGLLQLPLLEEVLEALKARAAPPRWREQALDIFFQEFSNEELDLQVKISENVLSNNENKAMVFCKMPPHVRQHWVGKFREMHQLNKSS